uniref:Tudor domain-containing protein n=1 Tax=Florenciella parvula TaxID=236787 RepID=A0A7S2BLC5_9STRA|mmetsp:Transcript_17931/g.37499  ORF Transcript_17931/g.37499 Transcript_17931/m.37499 type:complete len:174 (+) Transcript_17931:106-627(+)
MADGEYDIMGNLIGGPAAADGGGAAAAEAEATPAATPAKEKKTGFAPGDAVEIKEGGKVYRPAVCVKFDEGIGAVDVKYEDGETEFGIPLNLVRAAGSGGSSPAPPAAMQSPKPPAISNSAPAPVRRSVEKSSGDKPIAKQIYSLVKQFSQAEQEAALAMLMAMDSIRGSRAQ